jgi:phosphate starvation-inducible protein PhoH and related proteins
MGVGSMEVAKNKYPIQLPEIGFYNLRQEMTDEQVFYATSILNKRITFSNSKAGTGKTTVAVACMKLLYELRVISKAYYIFSPVEEKTLGHRPGNTKEKEADYLVPLTDALIEIGEQPEKAMHEEFGWIEAKSDTFLRGTNMKGVGVILEESQNYTRGQLKKTLTRAHDNSHYVVIGHDGQIDLKNKKNSGFVYCMEHFSILGEDKVGIAPLTKNFRGWIAQHADLMED